jgi:hypothetical protein
MTEPKPTQVGFDRFIAYDWIEYTLDLAAGESNDQIRRDLLKQWLNLQIAGEVSARKTYNLLARIWFVEYPQTAQMRFDALISLSQIPQVERLALHWGMCLANFRFFQDATAIIGRLLRLQGEFSAGTLSQRLLEIYSNQGTVPRSAARLIQTFRDWGVIREGKQNFYQAANQFELHSTTSIAFLLECALNNQNNTAWALPDLLRKPELFPFQLDAHARQTIQDHPRLHLSREGSSTEIITISGNMS